MLIRKRTKTVRLSNLVTSARAGLIPACDDVADEADARLDHAAHLLRTMRRVGQYTAHASDEQVLTAILADLRRYCAAKSLPFEKLDAAAVRDNDD